MAASSHFGPGSGGEASLRPLEERDLPAAARVLALAATTDPLLAWVLGHTDPERSQGLWHHFLEAHLKSATITVADRTRSIVAAAVWLGPETTRLHPLRRRRLRRAAALSGTPGARRRAALAMGLSKGRPSEPFRRLVTIGVTPAEHGLGLGTRLMAAGLGFADVVGLPAYTESGDPGAVPFLQRFGFEIVEKTQLADDGPAVWRLGRSPQRGGGRRHIPDTTRPRR